MTARSSLKCSSRWSHTLQLKRPQESILSGSNSTRWLAALQANSRIYCWASVESATWSATEVQTGSRGRRLFVSCYTCWTLIYSRNSRAACKHGRSSSLVVCRPSRSSGGIRCKYNPIMSHSWQWFFGNRSRGTGHDFRTSSACFAQTQCPWHNFRSNCASWWPNCTQSRFSQWPWTHSSQPTEWTTGTLRILEVR